MPPECSAYYMINSPFRLTIASQVQLPVTTSNPLTVDLQRTNQQAQIAAAPIHGRQRHQEEKLCCTPFRLFIPPLALYHATATPQLFWSSSNRHRTGMFHLYANPIYFYNMPSPLAHNSLVDLLISTSDKFRRPTRTEE